MDFYKSAVGLLILLLIISVTNLDATNKDEIKTKAFSDSYIFERNGKYDAAITAIKAVYEESSYEMNLRLGWLHYMSGLFSESMAYYQKAIKLLPYSLEAKFGLVLPAAALGNWAQVETQYKEILDIDPKNTLANYRLGLIYYGRKDYGKAVKHFELVTNLYPFDYDSAIMLGWTYYFLNKYKEAKVMFLKSLLMKPDDTSAQDGLKLIK